MKPPPFAYHAPDSLEEVLALLARHGPDARCMAGGQSLIPLMNLRMARPEVLIDLNRCAGLAQVEQGGGYVTFGAMVRQRVAELSQVTAAACPLIARALAHAGPVAVRNRGTVGGTLAHADRSAELPGVAVALDAVMVLAGAAGEREVAARDFFQGDMATAVEPDEMLRAVRFPAASPGVRTQFLEVGVRREGVAMVGLAAQILLGPDGSVVEARLAATGLEPAPVRLSAVEQALAGRDLSPALIAEAAALASASVDPVDDPFVPARYRRRVAGSLVGRALEGVAAQTEAAA